MNWLSLCLLILALPLEAECAGSTHPPMRPLHTAVTRNHTPADSKFIDSEQGDDTNYGSRQKPWKTIAHALSRNRPGTTLILRGGVYHEHIQIRTRATATKPLTIRSADGEIAIIDGGIPELFLDPKESWEPIGNGEYRSKSVFPDLPRRKDAANLLGNFAETMIPLHGYRFDTDLRSDNHFFHKLPGPKTARSTGLYCGPGAFLNPTNSRIHVRLAHTAQPSIGETNNYRGETDPRKLRLVIAGGGRSPITVERASHIILRNLVVRGARDATINIVNSANITLDNVTSYGGSSALRVESTSGLRCVNSAFRGIAAPWLWRWSLKYRSIEARIVSASSWNPPARPNRDFEFAFCEFTDCVDGVFVGNVDGVEIHHCLLDNISDDGFFITCRTAYDGTTTGRSSFHHNRISRTLTSFAFGVGHGRQKTINTDGHKHLGAEVQIYENVFDLREPVLYQQPVSGPITTFGRVAGDHGSPAWEPIAFTRNTVLMQVAPWRSYYAAGWAKAMGKGTRRRIERNLFVHETGMPGEVLPPADSQFVARENLHWSREARNSGRENFLRKFRNSSTYDETQWTKDDIYGDPDETPDYGTAPQTVPVGRFGHISRRGKALNPFTSAQAWSGVSNEFQDAVRIPNGKRAAMVLGYPAFDAPMLKFALEKAGVVVDTFERELLPVQRFGDYELVAFLGNPVRAKMAKTGFTPAEFPLVHHFLRAGGKILMGRELPRFLFPGDDGRKFLQSITGTGLPRARPTHSLLKQHAWTSGLQSDIWIPKSAVSITAKPEFNLIGDLKLNRSILARVPDEDGLLIYLGWNLSKFLPSGRKPSTIEMEANYARQCELMENIVADILSSR